jgi:hypothetical protein
VEVFCVGAERYTWVSERPEKWIVAKNAEANTILIFFLQQDNTEF